MASSSAGPKFSSTALVLAISILLVAATPAARGYMGRKVGGRTEISDVRTNEEVQKLGRFSVEEYNRMQQQQQGGEGGNGEILVFSAVVEAQRQVVAGIKYFLKIEAWQYGVAEFFDSVVVIKPWEQSRELLSFGPSRERGSFFN